MNEVKGFQALHSRGNLCCHVHQSTVAGNKIIINLHCRLCALLPERWNVRDLGCRGLGHVILKKLSQIALLGELLDNVPGIVLQVDSNDLRNIPVLNQGK